MKLIELDKENGKFFFFLNKITLVKFLKTLLYK